MSDAQAPIYVENSDGPGFYAQPEHTLRFTAWSAIAGVTLNLAAVVLDDSDCARPFLYNLLPTSNGVATVQTGLPLECGCITSMQVFASAGLPLGAQVYVRVELLQGREGAVQSLGTILEGYVTANVALCYPGDNTSRAVDGRGTFRLVLGTVPAAGADFVDTVPANRRWGVTAIAFTLVPSVAAANRTPVLTIDDGANIIWESSNNANVVASTTSKFRAGAGVQLTTVQANIFQIPLPELLQLPAGSRIRSVTGSLQAADQFNAILYNVEEWFDV
jgi:hypothetical protein